MNSTNDGKDVKSNQTSGHKGKTYYIELYKSLEARLSGESSGADRTRLVCEAWRRVYSLCQHSAPSTHLHLLSWLQRHTSHTILQTEWQSPKSKEQHTWLEDALKAFITECQEAISKRNGVSFSWENQLCNRASWFRDVLPNPWGHSVLKSLLDSRGPQPNDKEVLEWLKEERGVMFVARLRQLAASKCDDLALLLVTAVMDRVRRATVVISDAQQAEEPKDKPEIIGLETSFPNILRKEAGFTMELWELIMDIEFVLLYRGESRTRCIELAKQTPLRNGYQLVERLHSRLENSPQEKKLWKNSKDVATLIAQVVIARCMVVPSCVGVARAALYGCMYSLVQLLPAEKLPTAAAALAAPAATSRHLHTLAVAVHAQCKEARKPFVCSLYVRAITAGMNELENLKLTTEKESEARSMEQTLASWFIQLGVLLAASSRLSCECILTAFSVHPSPAMYDRVKRAPPLAPLMKPDIQELEPTTSSEFGSWATDSRTQTNLVKTSETLNLKQSQKQANVLSTAIFTEGEGLGLEADLCQDLAVLLSGPRVKTLYWDLDKEVLLENCRTYLEKTHGGTRVVTTELKYLNLDPTSFQHLPEEEDDENDIYYGIEKGYEHHVDFEEPLDDYEHILSDDSISTDTAPSLVELPIAIPKRKKNKSKQLQLSSEEEIDPLSFISSDIIKKDKKERTHNKERRKDKSKDRDKNKCKHKVDGDIEYDSNNGSIEDKNKDIQRREKKKERKERKKRDKLELSNKIELEHLQTCGNLVRLVGTKIIRVSNTSDKLETQYNTNVNVDKNICTDSDYDSQGKSSITSVNSEFNENASFDSLSTMDMVKAPPTENKQKKDIPSILNAHRNDSFVKEEVKKGIQKLIEYRRHKVSNESLKYPDVSLNHSDSSFKHLPNILYSSVTTPTSVIVPKLSKTSSHTQEIIVPATENEPNIFMDIKNEKSHLRDENYSTTYIKDSQALLNRNSLEKDPDKPSNQNHLSKHMSSYMNQGGNMVTSLQRKQGNIQEKNNSKEFIEKHPNFQSLKQVVPSLRNLSKSPSQNIPQMSNVTPSQKQFHNFLKELQETINAGAVIDKSIPDKTPCFKKTMQPKKTENAPNTFARLSYMHKNKQFDHKPKLKINPTVKQNKSMQNMTVGQIQLLKEIDEKVSHLQSKGEIVISRVDKSKNKSLNENSKVLVQKIENINGSSTSINNSTPINHNKTYPVISNMLSSDKRTSDCTIPSKIEINDIKQCNIPTPQNSKTTFLSEKDQFDLVLLLRQQSKMNPPVAPVKLQFQKKNISGITIANHSTSQYPKSEKPSLCRRNTPSKVPDGSRSQSYSASVITATNKLANKASEPKKNRFCKGSSKKSISKQKIKNNDADCQSDWKSVMDDLLAHKTPSRGPNALDVLLKKDSFEKRSSDSSGIQNQGTAVTNCKHLSKTSGNNNIPLQQISELNTVSTNSSILLISKSSEKSKKNYCTDIIKNNPAHTHGKHFPSVIQNSNDPFISGIPNSDYDLLEELMDDDLRQEIGELSSDDDAYRSAILSNSKTKNNLFTKESEILLNSLNAVAASNSHNNNGANYSTSNLKKTSIQKTSADGTYLKPQILLKDSFTEPVCVKNSVVYGKARTKVSDTTQQKITSPNVNIDKETTFQGKSSPINITPKSKNPNINKIAGNVYSKNNLPQIVQNPKIHTDNNDVHETCKVPIILDSAQVLLAVPETKTASNVVLIGSDLIYDSFSTLQTNSSKISGNLADLNKSTTSEPPMNLTLLHTTPFHAPVSTPGAFESSSVPVIQKLPNKDFQYDKIKLKSKETQQISLNEELQELSQSTFDSTNPLGFDLLHSTNIASNVSLSDPLLSNYVSGDINTNLLKTHKKSSFTQKLSESIKNPDLNRNVKRKVSAKLQHKQRCDINYENNTNDPVNQTTSFAKNDSDSKDKEQMQKKSSLLLKTNVHNPGYDKSIALLCNETMQSEINLEKQISIIENIENKYEAFTRQNMPIKTNICQDIQLSDRERNIKLSKANKNDKYSKQTMENNDINKDINAPVASLSSQNNVNIAEYETNVKIISKHVNINEVQNAHHIENIRPRFLQLPYRKAVNNEILTDKNKSTFDVGNDMAYTKQNYESLGTKNEKLDSYSQNDILAQEKIDAVNFEENLTGTRKEKHQDEIKCTSQQFLNNPDFDLGQIKSQTEVYTNKRVINNDKKISKAEIYNKNEVKTHNETEGPSYNADTSMQVKSILPKTTIQKPDISCHHDKVGIIAKNDNMPLQKEPRLISHCMIPREECDVNSKIINDNISDVSHSESLKESILDTNQCTGPLDREINEGIKGKQVITAKNINDHQSKKIIESNDISKDICTKKISANKYNEDKSNNVTFLGHKIVFDEMHNPNNGPFKRCVRIKLPNGNSFKVTISGKLNVKIDSIFEDPTVKSLLLKNIYNNTKCTLNIQHVSIPNKTPILTTEVRNANPVINSETINLISDDEDSDSQSFKTEFGNFTVSSMDQNIHKKHQKKLSLKSMVLLDRCKVLQSVVQASNKSNELEMNSIRKENQLLAPKQTISDYIEIDDSSDDCADESNALERNNNDNINEKAIEKVNNLKNLLLKDLGVEQNSGDNKTDDLNTNIDEMNKNKEVVPRIPNNENKLKICVLKLEKCDELYEKLRIKNQKCFVNLIRFDQVMIDSDKKVSNTENITLNPDETTKTTLKRSDSESILNKLMLDNPNDSIKELQLRVSPSLIKNFDIPTNYNLPVVNMIHLSDNKCDADWFTTKTLFHKSCNIIHQLSLPTLNLVDEHIKYDDSSTDCESDLESSLSNGNDIFVENKIIVPSLVTLLVNFFASRSDLMDRIIMMRLPLENVTQCSALKRKATDGVYLRQNKISKTKDYFRSETMCFTRVIKQKPTPTSVNELNSLSSDSVIKKSKDVVIDRKMEKAKDHVLNANCKKSAVSYNKSDHLITTGQNTVVSEIKACLNFEKNIGLSNTQYMTTHMCGSNRPSNALENVAAINIKLKEDPTATNSFISEKSTKELVNRETKVANAISKLDKSKDIITGESNTGHVINKNKFLELDVITCKTNCVEPENRFALQTKMEENSIEIFNNKFVSNLATEIEMLDETYIIEDVKLKQRNKEVYVNEKKAQACENSSAVICTPDMEEPLHSKFDIRTGPQNKSETSSEVAEKNNAFSLIDKQDTNSRAVFKENLSLEENYPNNNVHKLQLFEYALTKQAEIEEKDVCFEEGNKESEKLTADSPSTTVNVPVTIITENRDNILEINNLCHNLINEKETKEKKTYSFTNASCSETSENLGLIQSNLDIQLKTQIKNTSKISNKFKCSLKDFNLPEIDDEKYVFKNETYKTLKHSSSLRKTVLNPHVPLDRPDIDKDIKEMKKSVNQDFNTSNNVMILQTRCNPEASSDDHDENSDHKNSIYADTEMRKVKSKPTINKKYTELTWPVKKYDNEELETEVSSQIVSNYDNNKLQITQNLQTDVFALKLTDEKSDCRIDNEEMNNSNNNRLSILPTESRSNSITDKVLVKNRNIPLNETPLTPIAKSEVQYSSFFDSRIFTQVGQEFGSEDKSHAIGGETTSSELQQKLMLQVDSSKKNVIIYDPLKESTDNITYQMNGHDSLNVTENKFNNNPNREEEIAAMTVEKNNKVSLESVEQTLEQLCVHLEELKSFECQKNVKVLSNKSEVLKKKSKINENETCILNQDNILQTKHCVIDSVIIDKNNDKDFILETLSENNFKTLPKLHATNSTLDAKVKYKTDTIDCTNIEQIEDKFSHCSNAVTVQKEEKDIILDLFKEKHMTFVKENLKPNTVFIENTHLVHTKYDLQVDVQIENTLSCESIIKHQDNIGMDNDYNLTSKCDFPEAISDPTDNFDEIGNNEMTPKYVNNDSIEDCLSNTNENKNLPSSNTREQKNNSGLRITTVLDHSESNSILEQKCDMTGIDMLPDKLLTCNITKNSVHKICNQYNSHNAVLSSEVVSSHVFGNFDKCADGCSDDKTCSNVTSTTLQVLTTTENSHDHDRNNLVIKQSTPLIQNAINFHSDDYIAQNIKNSKSAKNYGRKTGEVRDKTISKNTNTNLLSATSSILSNMTCQVNCNRSSNIKQCNVKNQNSVLEDLTKDSEEQEIAEKTDISTSYDNKLQKNVTLLYKGDSSYILKGSIYEDPVVGTCYLFPITNRASMIQEPNCNNMCANQNDNVIESLKSKVLEDYQNIGNFKVLPPKITYSRKRFINDDDVNVNKKCRNNLKRKLVYHESKLSVKRYRKGKNIDYPKFTVTTMLESAYSKEYKRLLDYCSSIKFSFSRSYHKEYIDVPAILNYWPITKIDVKVVTDNSDFENVLFSEYDKEVSFDPMQQTLVEEISSKRERLYTSDHISETNFNMGFGDGSDRVITSDGNNNISIVSAATLSDVKQSQPFLTSEDKADNAYKQKMWMPNKSQIEILKRSISYIQLRDKIRSFFKKSAAELHYNWEIDNMKHKNTFHNKHVNCKFPYGLLTAEFIEPAPIETVVQVVQVGQLPFSAAAQNPVTCDPRVTQVTDASPQCSMENSPHDDSQSPIKTEYTELTTADLSLPLVQEYERQIMESQESSKMLNCHHEDIPVETEMTSIVKTEITVELSPLKEEPIDYENDSDDLQSLVNKHINNVEYTYDSNDNTILETQSSSKITYDSLEKENDVYSDQQVDQNGITEKTDQIAHAMNAAGITTTPETLLNQGQHDLVDTISQKNCQEVPTSTSLSPNNYSKSPINAMTLQQALAQILPPPLNEANIHENNQTTANSSMPSQVLHIVQGKNTNGNQITLVENTQNSVISNTTTPVLHIVQNKGSNIGSPPNSNSGQHTNSYSGLSLVDTGIQQGNNQLLHIVNTNNQKNNSTGQILKRVNLLTNLTNVQGSNEQKVVQFVCKSADGKSIHLNAPHQRSMVLRLQPIESPTIQTTSKEPECQDSSNPTSNTNIVPNKESSACQHEIKSRSVYEENYAKFIQSSSNKSLEKSTSLPKFNQAFGKQIFQDNNQKGNDLTTNNSNMTCVNSNSENSECRPNENSVNLDHIGEINSPPLLLRKNTTHSVQTQPSAANLVQQIKQTIAPMNIQTMHGGVIYTRQIPVNIGGGQTINLITVPTTELIDDANQKQKGDIKFINQNDLDSPIIKIVPQSQTTPNTESMTDESTNQMGFNSESTQNAPTQHQPVLTQMRIKLPMLSKTHQMVSGARVVRPSFFQIQRNVIGGANQHVYQQLVLTAAPPLGQHTIRLPQSQACRQIKIASDGQSSSEPQMSSSTLEQLREFDMVLEQVKERSTVQPNANQNNTITKLPSPSCDTIDSTSVTSTVTESTQQVLYSIGSNQSLNIAYVNRKSIAATPTTSTFIRSPDSSGITEPPSSTHVQVPNTVTNGSSLNEGTVQQNQQKPAKVGSKSKSRPKSSNPSNSLKINTVPPKTSTQKPLEDEQTTQRILYILAEYKEQVENSPDKDKPAPRRRSNPPTNPSGSSKRKKSSSGSRRPGVRDTSPVHGEDTCRTMGSEDSSCGTSLGDCNENCLDNHSPQNSPTKVNRKLSFDGVTTSVTQSRPQPQRNVIVADGQTITVARGATGKPATAVLMPTNYILPVSMVKGGQQIAIVTNRGPKLLTVGGSEGGATNALLLQRLIGPAGLKPVLARPGVRHVRLPTAALHNLHAFNLSTATNVQPPDSTVSPASAPPPDLVETRPNSSPWADRERQPVKPERESSPEGSEPWNLPTPADPQDYTYEDRVRTENMDRTVLVVHRKDGSSQRHHRLTHVSAAALRHKYAILEHELRLQKSLSEECEDLGVDSPSASELFPEAELLFSSSPAHEATQHSHTPQPTIIHQSGITQPDIDDQIATDELLQREVHDDHQELDVRTLGLDEGIVTVSEDGLQATIALDQEEFARSHPNTTFHSEPTEEGEVEPYTIAGLKGRHITSTIFHAGRAPATVLVTAPQTSVISQATTDNMMHNNLKYADMDQIINSSQGTHDTLNLSSALVKDDRTTKFDNILTDNRELHLSNTASAIVHATGNATQVIRRVCYEDDKRDARFIMDEPEGLIAGDDAKMIAEDNSRDNSFESIAGDVDDDNSYQDRHTELFWESNSASERSEGRRPLDFSSDSDKCCKSPSYDETNSTDSSGIGTQMRLDSVIKDARGIDRSGSADGSSADDMHPPLRTYPAKRVYHPLDGEMERSISGKTRAGERSPDILEGRRRASGRGVVKRGCHCCTGSPAPPRPKKSRQRKPNMDYNN